mmetsp:Transcript_126147/g.218610  ORF Transcript_126147/g.218610 Transcript_126147/m.218610 type:complete len:480 (-) Transcript_126147:332-1771(-)
MASALAMQSISSNESLCEPDPAFAWEMYAEESRPKSSWRLGELSSSSLQSPEDFNMDNAGQAAVVAAAASVAVAAAASAAASVAMEAAEYSTSASSSQLTQRPAESCEELKPKDDDADDSTNASDADEGASWADFEEIDDEKDLIMDNDEHEMKDRPTEIIDQDPEVKEQPAEKEGEKTARTLWADLVDDSDEGELYLGFPQGDGEAEPVAADTVAASSSKRRSGKKSKKAKPQELAASDSKAQQSNHTKPAEEAHNGKKGSGKGKRQEVTKTEEKLENAQRRSKDSKGRNRSDANSYHAESSKNTGKGAASKGSGKGACKGSGKGAANQAGKGSGKSSGAWSSSPRYEDAYRFTKRQCQYTIGIEEDSKFHVVRRLLGPKGRNMKAIADKTDSRLRLRGRGSKFLEGPEWDQKESTDDLMLCISNTSADADFYKEAQKKVVELLKGIYREYEDFCRRTGQSVPVLKIQLHEGAREGSR